MFESLTDRLRDEIARQLSEAVGEVAGAARTDREAAINDAVARTRLEVERDAAARLHEEIAAAETRGHDRADAHAREVLAQSEQRARDMVDAVVAASRDRLRSADLAATERLIHAVRALDRARTLGDILETLVSCAGHEVARAGILLVNGRQLRGWRFIGFGPAFEAASTIVIPVDEGGIIAEAIRTDAAVSSGAPGRILAPAFAALASGRESLAVPVTMSGEVIAVLYADEGAADDSEQQPSTTTWPGTIEVMARHAARCLEAATAIKAMRVLTERPDMAMRLRSPEAADAAPASQNDEALVRTLADGDGTLLGHTTS
jgi:hypothetical protein